MKAFVYIAFLTIVLDSVAQTPYYDWTVTQGGAADDESKAVAVDPAWGDMYHTGYFQDTAHFTFGASPQMTISNGGSDVFIHKLSNQGYTIWVKSFGGPSVDIAHDIKIDTYGNIIVVGIYNGSIDIDPNAGTFMISDSGVGGTFILKLASSGDFIWAKSISGLNFVQGKSIEVDNLNNIYVGGSFKGTIDFDPGANNNSLTASNLNDGFILKLNENGEFIHCKQFECDQNLNLEDIEIRGTDLFATGYYEGTADFDPSTTSTQNQTSSGTYDAFVVKMDTSATYEWSKSFGGPDTDQSFGIAIDNNGNCYSTGRFQSTVDFDPSMNIFELTSAGGFDIFTIKLNEFGDFGWAHKFGSSNSTIGDQGWDIEVDDFGGVYTTGYFNGNVDFDPSSNSSVLNCYGAVDVFIQKLDTLGSFEWVRQFGGPGSDIGYDLFVDDFANIYTTGRFLDTAKCQIWPGTYDFVYSLGQQDGFIIKHSSTTSLNELESKKDNVFPNPCLSNNTISITNLVNGEYFIIVDIMGNKVLEGNYDGEIKLNLISPGNYFIITKIETDQISIPLIVE